MAIIDLNAFRENAAVLVKRAGGRPIRIASKSIRCRELLSEALTTPGYAGVMCFSLAEALWLVEAGSTADALVGYPTVDRAALRRLAADDDACAKITLMVDDVAQLDLIDAAVGIGHPPIRVCLELDAGWRPLGDRLQFGARRSPVHTPAQAAEFARAVVRRPGFRLVGVMAYESQIAGLANDPPRQRLRGALLRWMQKHSVVELAERRASAVAAVRAVAPLEFVNGGGTGSLETTSAEGAVTEVAAGSGLLGPALFDGYRHFQPQPAALFALPVVRRPDARVATVFGGGYLASGPIGRDRLPTPFLPAGLRLSALEGAGEVQTPLLGTLADELRVGDRVWFRHAKSGELAEHFTDFHLVDGDRAVDVVPTYRGERRSFG